MNALLRAQGIAPENLDEPLSLASATEKIREVIKTLKTTHFPTMEGGKPGCTNRARGGYQRGSTSPCDYCQRNFAADLTTLVDKHTDALQGMCLHCFGAGKEECFSTRDHAMKCKVGTADGGVSDAEGDE